MPDTPYSKMYGWWYTAGDTNSGFNIYKDSIICMYSQSDTIHYDACKCIITKDSISIFHPLRLLTIKYSLNDDTLNFKDSLDRVLMQCFRYKIIDKNSVATNIVKNRFPIIRDIINVDAEIEDDDAPQHVYCATLFISKGNDRYQIETVCEGCDTMMSHVPLKFPGEA